MRIRRQVEGWTDCALNVFTRHRGEDGSNYPDHNEMLKMNEVCTFTYVQSENSDLAWIQ